ncbi:MAG: low molecular weight protein arginine phosphatase [Elusimicrobia bacterium]|nr:low molecular weight protein arginine phosphatase [Elusimicrobiota bacterium]
MKLLFVCTGNVCRSLMAERLALDLGRRRGRGVEARSCGVAAEGWYRVPDEVWTALGEAGVAASPHRPRLVERSLLAWADEALVMTARHRELLRDAFPEFRGKTALLRERAGLSGDVADPIGQPLATFRACREQIAEALERLLPPAA